MKKSFTDAPPPPPPLPPHHFKANN
ncbi:unnamed protein product [Spirodela intermedia]|uniref:Uncharacterized protein n=1 Tax=Spirodela intermedia TaxID=51605 RepID=A0A7I8KVZ1_SPIIN|nr:unnamed protein product [Spirodela intermedia]